MNVLYSVSPCLLCLRIRVWIFAYVYGRIHSPYSIFLSDNIHFSPNVCHFICWAIIPSRFRRWSRFVVIFRTLLSCREINASAKVIICIDIGVCVCINTVSYIKKAHTYSHAHKHVYPSMTAIYCPLSMSPHQQVLLSSLGMCVAFRCNFIHAEKLYSITKLNIPLLDVVNNFIWIFSCSIAVGMDELFVLLRLRIASKETNCISPPA